MLSYTAIVTTDGGHVQRGGENIQRQLRPALHLFGPRRSAEKQPPFKTVHFAPDLEHSIIFEQESTLGKDSQPASSLVASMGNLYT
ncbi:hypothetical protein FOMG_18990 [Fusarium oxysporum f. sp. melonis 26406]|uniref:Uncharacterized protein n=1 Tax=Fusarium oxysporum f. sp. melonis 26406 TaxID=1089452 RepID=W9YYN9_FUSOX|nr:hypothetical protein FOMG_18990 [Fusarium oxysporum f. sp. melonis 26406]